LSGAERPSTKNDNLVDQGDSCAWVRVAYSRVIGNDLLTGACMPLGFHPAVVERGEADAHTDRQEQIVTVVAASTAVLIVAAIAFLMGMA
jgi:hypothetical protein